MPAEILMDDHSNPLLIQVDHVDKLYPTPAGDVPALRDVSLQVRRGEYVGVIGRSGAGKTTLLSVLTGIDHLTSGRVQVNGTAVHKLSEDALAQWRGVNIGVIYQSFHLMPTLSLLDNVLLPMDFCGLLRGSTSYDRAMSLLEQVGLKEHAFKRPAAISGGQRQRVAIARALANDPPIIVADEPTGRLDSGTAETIFSIFRDLVDREGKTLVMVTHDRSLATRVDRVIELEDGQIRGHGSAGSAT